MKTTLLLSILALGLTSVPALAQDFIAPSGPPRNALEQRLQDRVNAQIELDRARGIRGSGDVRRDQRYERREPRYERRDRAERRWEREDRRRWERQERRRDRYWDGW